MKKADLTKLESILGNLHQWCFEVGSEFEQNNIAAVVDFVETYKPVGTVVELGCGDGAALKAFEQLGIKTFGVDINKEKLDKAPGDTALDDVLDWLVKQPRKSVDNIFTHHALEHMVHIDEVLAEIGRVLKPGGLYYAVVPAHDHVHEVHHVAFESAKELLPKGLKQVKLAEQERFGAKEYLCIAKSQS